MSSKAVLRRLSRQELRAVAEGRARDGRLGGSFQEQREAAGRELRRRRIRATQNDDAQGGMDGRQKRSAAALLVALFILFFTSGRGGEGR